jgi:UDP-GlcNAc:undecaprenyl-phosphate GlcNAc-1-phosphate transferase
MVTARDSLVVLAVTMSVTLVLTPVARLLAIRVGAVVAPDDRRVHERPTPATGGWAMILGLVAGLVVASRLDSFRSAFSDTSEPLGVLIAAVIMFGVGAVDDLRPISPPAKLAGQVSAGIVLSLLGVTLFYLRLPYVDLISVSPDIAPIVTVIWLMLMANAINLIDGLDGLASGIVAIASGSFFLYSLRLLDAGLINETNLGPVLSLVTLGLCLGFLPHNVHPARIFMGDSGAMLLGLMMATSTISVGGRVVDEFSGQTYFFLAPLAIPFVILGVPLLDTMFAVARRARGRSGIATADKGHLHHRLMRLGHGHWRSVLILWAWTGLLSAMVLYPTFTGDGDAIVPIGVLGMALGLYSLFAPGRSTQQRRSRSALPGER